MNLERGVLYAGVFLEVFGLALTAWGLLDLRANIAGRPPLRRIASSQMRRFTLLAYERAERLIRKMIRRPKPRPGRQMSGTATLGAAGTVQTRVIWNAYDESMPIDERLRLLDQHLRQLKQDHEQLEKRLERETRARREALIAERETWGTAVAGLRDDISELAAGGLGREAFGLSAFLLGSVFANLPEGTAATVRALFSLVPGVGGGWW